MLLHLPETTIMVTYYFILVVIKLSETNENVAERPISAYLFSLLLLLGQVPYYM